MTSKTSTAEAKNLRCPAGIETLLWYHCRCEPYKYPSGVHDEYMALLLEKGCIVKDKTSSSGYRTTPKGAFMVRMICETPFPEETFCDPRFDPLHQ